MSRSSHPETPTIYDGKMLSPRQIGTSQSAINRMIDEGVMTSEVSHSAGGDRDLTQQLQDNMHVQLNVRHSETFIYLFYLCIEELVIHK